MLLLFASNHVTWKEYLRIIIIQSYKGSWLYKQYTYGFWGLVPFGVIGLGIHGINTRIVNGNNQVY